MDLVDYIYDECQRQHVTNYGDFARAWDRMSHTDSYMIRDPLNFGLAVQLLAQNVEPEVNRWEPLRNSNLRTSHVSFMDGGTACPAGEVRERFDRWCKYAYELAAHTDLLGRDDAIEHCIKALLDIHPWADGNGRTASILRNWMLGQLDSPEPLPFYYGNV